MNQTLLKNYHDTNLDFKLYKSGAGFYLKINPRQDYVNFNEGSFSFTTSKELEMNLTDLWGTQHTGLLIKVLDIITDTIKSC